MCVYICFKQKKNPPLSVCPLVLLFPVASSSLPLHRSVCISIPTSLFTFSTSHFAPSSPSRCSSTSSSVVQRAAKHRRRENKAETATRGHSDISFPLFFCWRALAGFLHGGRRELKGTSYRRLIKYFLAINLRVQPYFARQMRRGQFATGGLFGFSLLLLTN